MRHPIYTVSNYTLKKDLKHQKRLKNSVFTMTSYRIQEHLEHQSERILQSFAEGHLTLEKNQYKYFAKYIDAFGGWRVDEHFDHLQKLADFDVREYVKDSKISLWNKMFPKKSHGIVAKTPRQMKKEMKRYIKACRNGDEFKAYNLRENAEMYVKSFIKGEFSVPSENVRLFKDYIHTILYPVYAGSEAEKAMQKLRDNDYETTETEKANATSKAADKAKATWGNVKGFFSKMSDKITAAPQKIKMPKMHMPKVSMPKVSMPK